MKASVDATGDVEFNLISGQTGSRQMVFQLVSNQSDFLSYSYLVYGIKEDEYRKVQESLNVTPYFLRYI